MKQVIQQIPQSLPTIIYQKAARQFLADEAFLVYKTCNSQGNSQGLAILIRSPITQQYGFVYYNQLLRGQIECLKFEGSSAVHSLQKVLSAGRELIQFDNAREFTEFAVNFYNSRG